MIRYIKNWFQGKRPANEGTPQTRSRRASLARKVRASRRAEDAANDARAHVDLERTGEAHIESRGPGKNVLIRNKYHREDSGTHETLKIVDDSVVDSGEETGIDPYNTGNFDRSSNWDKRFRN